MPQTIDINFIVEQFSEYKQGDNIVCNQQVFRNIIDKKSTFKKKRSQCSYFVWLGENRDKIREKYFSDFDDVQEWDLSTKKNYYSSKDLPLDKVTKPGRPRIVSLITTKAGIIWKSLSAEEKMKYENKANDMKDNYEVVEVKPTGTTKRGRGRPKKKKETNNISDAVVDKYNKDVKNDQEKALEESDEIKVEELMYEGKLYYLDINNNDIYDPESSEIVGKKIGNKVNIN